MPPAWPGPFTIRGRMTANGENFNVANACSDAHLRIRPGGSVYEMCLITSRNTAVGGGQGLGGLDTIVTYTECPTASSLLTGWTQNYVQYSNGQFYPNTHIGNVPNTQNRYALDTVDIFRHPLLNVDIATWQSRPGELPSGVIFGDANIIQGAVGRGVGASRTWCQHPPRVLQRGTESWGVPYIFTNGFGNQEASGGVNEQALIWRPDTQQVIMFFQGWTNYSGADHHRMGRAVHPTGLGYFQLDPTTPVISPQAEGNWGSADIGMEQHVTLDPDGQTLWCVGIGTLPDVGPIGIWIQRSDDWGYNWVWNPANPILSVNSAGLPTTNRLATDRLGSPQLVLDHTGTKWLLQFTFKNLAGGAVGGPGGGIYISDATYAP